jgi:hypothetical protein
MLGNDMRPEQTGVRQIKQRDQIDEETAQSCAEKLRHY